MTERTSKSLGGSDLFYLFISTALWILYKLFFRLRVYGVEKVPTEADPRGVILAPNHVSYLDPPIFGISLKRRVTFLAKEYLFGNWAVGIVLRGIGAYPVRSNEGDIRGLRELVRILERGCCVTVFPEGTRSADGTLKAAGGGVGFLAVKSGAVVVPAYVQGTFEAFPRGAKWFRCLPVKAYYGEPFVPALDEKLLASPDPYRAVTQKIMDEIAKLKEKVDLGQI